MIALGILPYHRLETSGSMGAIDERVFLYAAWNTVNPLEQISVIHVNLIGQYLCVQVCKIALVNMEILDRH